jgi:hypothetical protein
MCDRGLLPRHGVEVERLDELRAQQVDLRVRLAAGEDLLANVIPDPRAGGVVVAPIHAETRTTRQLHCHGPSCAPISGTP